ncbi:DUF6776 family protein [Salinibius halmophilus]|uniref:DUF6776 family protein n=1 Tax=Salinibius halmophilus TaxID=1853216 RepID=UPI000E66B7F1|nr:DUF6776 family protein [Salinibius halmophilus]
MPHVKGSPQPKLKVAEAHPFRAFIGRFFVLILIVASLAAGYILGSVQPIQGVISSDQYALRDNERLRDAVKMLGQDLGELQATIAQQDKTIALDKATIDALREENRVRMDELRQVREELSLFKGIMAPEEITRGPHIKELQLNNVGNRAFEYNIVFTQEGNNDNFVEGSAIIILAGQSSEDEDAPVMLPLAEVSEQVQDEQVKLRYRYFQNVEGVLNLPADFVPSHIEVIMQLNSGQRLNRLFDWSPTE